MSYPRLFDGSVSDMDAFDNALGLGVLSDATSCTVTGQLNGEYELELTYPLDGQHFEQIGTDRLIAAKPYRDAPRVQPFRIYAESKPLNGEVTFYARHISYDALGVPVRPFVAASAAAALVTLTQSMVIQCPFTFATNIDSTENFVLERPAKLQAVLLGTGEGSLTATYNGELVRDGYNIQLLQRRGADRGARIVYGRNLIDLTQEKSIEEMYDAVYPYYVNSSTEDGQQAGVTELADALVLISAESAAEAKNVFMLDLSNDFDETPTAEQMQQATARYIEKNGLDKPKVTLSVKYVDLSRTQEYADMVNLDHIELGDTVTVQYARLGVDVKARVTALTYDVLRDEYESLTVGDVQKNLSGIIAQNKADSAGTASSLRKLGIKADEAARYATDYLNYSESGGLVISQPGRPAISVGVKPGGLDFHGIRNQTPLWTNSDISSGASTPSSFGAQTISLDLSSYSAVMIVFTSSVDSHWNAGAENGEMTALTLPINGQTYTLLYPYNTVTRRNVQVRTDGLRFYGGYERWQDYNLGIINSFELDVPWDAGWTLDNNCCVPCYIYGFM